MHNQLFLLFLLAPVLLALKAVPATPVDSKATASTRQLLKFLSGVYGKYILSGQYNADDVAWVKGITGKTAAVAGYDLMDYSPSRIGPGKGNGGGSMVESSISWAKSTGGIITLSWHWNAPMNLIDQKDKEWWRGFYTYATTYDVAYALANTNSAQYTALIRDIDAIAVQLKKYQAADIPLLWRPLHEAAGEWFWWGAKGVDAFKKLWRLMYDRYTNHHQIHNLIWVFTIDNNKGNWYPGDDVVDINGMDNYVNSGDPMKNQWNAVTSWYDGKKMLSLSECGHLPPIDESKSNGIWWLWFAVWSGDFIRKENQNTIKQVYNHASVLTADEINWRAGTVKGGTASPPPTTGCTDVPVPGDTYGCAQQASWGKCAEAWMQGYCKKSCNKC